MGSDTLLAINYSQLVLINKGLNGYIHSIQRDSLLNKRIELKDKTINLKDSVISSYSVKCKMLSEEYLLEKSYSENLSKQIIKEKRKHKIASVGVGVIGAVAGFVAGVILR